LQEDCWREIQAGSIDSGILLRVLAMYVGNTSLSSSKHLFIYSIVLQGICPVKALSPSTTEKRRKNWLLSPAFGWTTSMNFPTEKTKEKN
jgi:hypothetical protein